MLKPLPNGIQTFRDVINGGYLYVDKTQYLYELVGHPQGMYFLSRPRRFGKSLLISTLEAILTGQKMLFEGLWLHNSPYDWMPYPVIRIDFSRYRIHNPDDLEVRLQRHLHLIARQYQITLPDAPFDILFEELVLALSAKQSVVILIDEYDKPIIDNLAQIETAQAIQERLKDFYTLIKALDQYIRIVFITGISKFSRIGVFSTLNNLTDLTLSPRFATLLGFTEAEIRHNFQEYITSFAKQAQVSEAVLLEQIRYWYNGFCFVGDAKPVYNPFSTLQLFFHQRFANYWFETGTPTFLIKLIKQHNYDVTQLNQLEVREVAFSTYDLENLSVVPLLFQTGYLTTKAYDAKTRKYTQDPHVGWGKFFPANNAASRRGFISAINRLAKMTDCRSYAIISRHNVSV